MRWATFGVVLLALLTLVVVSAIVRLPDRSSLESASKFSNEIRIVHETTPLPPCRREVVPATYQRVASIRGVDFRNFKYPGVHGCDFDVPTEPFQVRRGQYGDWHDGLKFRGVSFGDVSGDNRDEAVVSFAGESDGSGRRDAVYVFALEQNRPKAIYVFESGDRADGGLRRAYVEKGRFVLELWGPGNTLEKSGATDGTGLCCPKTFTRSYYQWRNGAFERQSFEILPNPEFSSE